MTSSRVSAAAVAVVRARLAELGTSLGAPASFAAETSTALLRGLAVCMRFACTALPANLSCIWDWLRFELAPECLAHFEAQARLQIPLGELSYIADAPARFETETELCSARNRFIRQHVVLFGTPFAWTAPEALEASMKAALEAEPVGTLMQEAAD